MWASSSCQVRAGGGGGEGVQGEAVGEMGCNHCPADMVGSGCHVVVVVAQPRGGAHHQLAL